MTIPTAGPAPGWTRGTGDPRSHPTGEPAGGRTGEARGDAGSGWTGEVPPGRTGAVVAGAARLSDVLMEVGEALVAALIGAVVGAGKAAAGIWVADRPRRQMARLSRRRRWLQRRGWWRVAVIAELVGIGAWMGGRAAVRAVRGVPGGAAQGARTGWATGRGRAQDRHTTRRGRPHHGDDRPPRTPGGPMPDWDSDWDVRRPTPDPSTPDPPRPGPSSSGPSTSAGEAIVDAEILCGRPGCDTVLASDDPGPLCPVCTKTRWQAKAGDGDDVEVSVEVVSPTGPAPAAERARPVEPAESPRAAPGPGPSSVLWSPDFDAYASGRIDANQIRCALCGQAPCACPEFGSPEYLALLDRRHAAAAWEQIRSSARPGDPCRLPDGRTGSIHTVMSDAIRVQIEGGPLVWLSPNDDGAQPAPAPQSPVGHPAAGPDPTGSTPDGSITQHDHEHDDVQEDTGMSTTDMTITSGSGGSGVQGGAQMGQQLTAVGDLRAEVVELRKYVETGAAMLRELESWAAGLPDQVAAAEWSTEAVTQAAVGLAEARTVEEVRSGITALLSAAAEAERLGQALAAGGATRGVAGLRPQ